MRVAPFVPMTGRTHVMHTPMPHAIASSTAHLSLYTRCFVEMRATSDNMGIGPHAYTHIGTCPLQDVVENVGDSAANTRCLPSSVVIVSAGRQPLQLQHTEQPVFGGGADDHVNAAAALA